ncbi:MAG TPA: c-type cytochrome [Gemmatimonadaceae bacterium]|nr:c-type cytochrome [Gemmatimonadaceae bacterium]
MTKPLAVMLLVLLAACGGEPRQRSATVDTAVALPYDTFAHESTTTSDSASDTTHATPPLSDSLMGTHTVPMLGGTAVVLRADSTAGSAIYHGKGRCFTCHGAQADGMATLGPSLIDTTWLHGNGSIPAIAQVVTKGIASPVVAQIAMPAFGGQLSPAEIHQVSAYVFALTHPKTVVGDTATVGGTRSDTTRANDVHTGTAPRPAAPPSAARDTSAITHH